uniref:transposase n=1 Tax=Paenibacillus tengchongensis TaxID=2608684 RepID=UPI001651CFA5
NATSHTARDTVNFLRANNIAFINDWPAKSPDLNPIEHLWDNLDQRVRRRPIPPSNVIQLRQALIQEWNNIPQAEINTLIRSMRQRCQAVLHAEGGHTRY